MTPAACTTFQGILTGSGAPVIITETPSDDPPFPQGVALRIAGQQMSQLEARYINAGTTTLQGTTHQHRLGTDFKVLAATSANDTSYPPIADTTDWANPPLYRLNPEIDFNGQNGLAYQCTWNNTTGQVVTFGETLT